MISGIPYDSYLIEIVESKNFMPCGCIIQFHSIQDNNFLKKFVGLNPQSNATPEVFVYYNKESPKDNNDFSNMELISDANVYLKRCIDDFGETANFDESSK